MEGNGWGGHERLSLEYMQANWPTSSKEMMVMMVWNICTSQSMSSVSVSCKDLKGKTFF